MPARKPSKLKPKAKPTAKPKAKPEPKVKPAVVKPEAKPKVVKKPVAKPVAKPKPEIIPEVPVVVAEPIPEPEKVEKSLAEIAQAAWDNVKGAGDASFAGCQAEFKSTLMAHAEAVQASGLVLGGDTIHAKFEQKVLELLIGG